MKGRKVNGVGFWQTFKSRFNKDARRLEKAEVLNSNTTVFTAWNGGAYGNDIYRGAVDAIARNIAKLKGAHVVYGTGTAKKTDGDNVLNRLLQIQPNPYMTAYDMLYKMATHYYLFNNSFAFLDKDDRGNVRAVFPITCTQADFLTDTTGALYVQFRFKNGNEVILPYSDIVHLRRNFNSDELLGDNNEALFPALELAHTENEGIVNGIKTGATIRGILKYPNVLNEEVLKESRDNFISQYLDVSNNGGIVVTDGKNEYVPIDNKPVTVDPEQTKATATKIYNYLGISEKIVNSTYNEEEWGAFFESVIEPFALLISTEFTRKVFTERELAFGNRIEFASGSMVYASVKTKLEMIKELIPASVLSVEMAREIMNLPPVAEGEKVLQTLNNVDATKANQYQLDEPGNDEEGVNDGNISNQE